jgi:glycolate oxidase iron-sulfur subunit
MKDLQADADLCVKCGLCLPHCPTYIKTQNENESPRGRISLIQAWAGNQLQATEKLLEHIDNCLLCRSCEKACPALVPYGRLIDTFRARVYKKQHSSPALFLLKKVAHNKTLNKIAGLSLRVYQTRLQKTARLLNLPRLLGFDRVDSLLTLNSAAISLRQIRFTALGEVKGTVGLFTGCMGLLLDQETVSAAIKVLTVAGYHVIVPDQQTCCGALDQHDGDVETAEQLAAINIKAFGELDLDAVVTIASGCGSQLKEFQQTDFAKKVVDISQFLVGSGCDLTGKLKSCALTVSLHSPCSLKNVMRQEQGGFEMLKQIPGITITTLSQNIQCCGSAGSYMLEHPDMAQALLNDLLAEVLEKQPTYLVTSNVGCALHLSAGLREKGVIIETIHPVALIARHLQD